MTEYIIPGIISLVGGYFIVNFIFDLLLRGFAPLIPSRPWVVNLLLEELEITVKNPKMVAFSSGRSGFFHALKKKYPDGVFIGAEFRIFPFLVALVQIFLRRVKIKIVLREVHRVEIKNVDLIYCHLKPDKMQDLGKKFKFECKQGTQIISTGFNIPYLVPVKVVDLPDRKGRVDWLSRNQNLFQRRKRKYKKEKKAYFYEI